MTDHQVDDQAEPGDDKASAGDAGGGDQRGAAAGEAEPVVDPGDGGGDRHDADDEAAADAAAAAPAGEEAEGAAGAGTGDASDEEGSDDKAPAPGKDRLEALQDDIDEVRRRVGDPLDDGDRSFVEEGEADEDQPVDDTIVPPG